MVCCFGEIISIAGPDRKGTARELSVPVRDNSVIVRNSDMKKIDPSNSHKIMVLNQYGEIVRERLLWLAIQYPYVVLHNYVVMPNHIHAILEIDSFKVEDKAIKIKSLSSMFGAFKTTSSKLIHQAGFLDFSWHRSFHDHIIQSESSYHNISNYIDQNPSKWNSDTFFGWIIRRF